MTTRDFYAEAANLHTDVRELVEVFGFDSASHDVDELLNGGQRTLPKLKSLAEDWRAAGDPGGVAVRDEIHAATQLMMKEVFRFE